MKAAARRAASKWLARFALAFGMLGAASANAAQAQAPEAQVALPADHVPSDPAEAEDALGAPSVVTPVDTEVPPGMHGFPSAEARSEDHFLVTRHRRLRATRWSGALLLVSGTLMGVLSPIAENPFAWGMTGVGLASTSLMLLTPTSGLYRSLQVELGRLDAGRWASMRRMRRRAGIGLLGVGFAALSFTAMTRNPEVIVIIGLPMGMPLAFAGANLLLASIDATPSTPRVQPTVSASAGRAGRGARVGVSIIF